MNCKQANQISIIDFFSKNGIFPKKKGHNYALYNSPLRIDNNPSFIIYRNTNVWKDLSTGESGYLIDFVMKWKNLSVKSALSFIESKPHSFSFLKQEYSNKNEIIVREVKPLIQHKALLDYLISRGINPETVKSEIKEVWYSIGDKTYFGIGFRNNSGGYEMRNSILKNSIGEKSVTSIKIGGSENVTLLEGFFDYLSFLMLGWNKKKCDYLIMNSTSLVKKAIPLLKEYKNIYSFLDNDNAGRSCFEQIKIEGINIIDCSNEYNGFTDLNEYLICKKLH